LDVFGGRGFFDGFVSSVMTIIAQTLGHWFGEWVNDPVLGPVTTADLFVAAIPIILALALDVVLFLIFRRQARIAPPPSRWHLLLRGGVRGPVYLFVWLAAIYFSLTPLLLKGWPDARPTINDFFIVAFLIALLWLSGKLTHIAKNQLNNWAVKIPSRPAKFVVPLVGRSLRAIVPAIIIISAWPMLGLSQRCPTAFWYFSGILIICVIAWILTQAVEVAERALLAQYDIGIADNLQARKIYTQTHLLSRTSEVTIGVLAIASILMLFPPVRHVGASVLASAGIVGVVAGIAAQKTLANFIAGFQIALAQPFRHDDVVIVESEWGRIEEITLTYVVVRIWDERRMVLPLTYFIEQPFQNWTRHTSTLMGSISFWVDYTFPVEEGRNALKGIVENNPLWDKRFWNLQVTDCDEKTMQLRVLATAADAGKAWDLRCAIREQFIAFIQKSHPKCLPRLRADIDNKIHHSHGDEAAFEKYPGLGSGEA
jgi:small-conductance mechanosensitive channel